MLGLLGATLLMACSPSQTNGKADGSTTAQTTTTTTTSTTTTTQEVPMVSPVTNTPFQTTNVQSLHEMLEKSSGVYVLDVRTPAEFAAGHVEGAINIPLDVLASRLGELPKDRSVHVICRSGSRSAQAADLLAKNGFDGVVNIDGGMNAWTAAGYPTVK